MQNDNDNIKDFFNYDYESYYKAANEEILKKLNEQYKDVKCHYDESLGDYVYTYCEKNTSEYDDNYIDLPPDMLIEIYANNVVSKMSSEERLKLYSEAIKVTQEKRKEYEKLCAIRDYILYDSSINEYEKIKRYYGVEVADKYKDYLDNPNINNQQIIDELQAQINALEYTEIEASTYSENNYYFLARYIYWKDKSKIVNYCNTPEIKEYFQPYLEEYYYEFGAYNKYYSEDESLRDYDFYVLPSGKVLAKPYRKYTSTGAQLASKLGVYYPSKFSSDKYPSEGTTCDDEILTDIYCCNFTLNDLKKLYNKYNFEPAPFYWTINDYYMWLKDEKNMKYYDIGVTFDSVSFNDQGGITVILKDEYPVDSNFSTWITGKDGTHNKNKEFLEFYYKQTECGREIYLKENSLNFSENIPEAYSKETFAVMVYKKLNISQEMTYDEWIRNYKNEKDEYNISEILQIANNNNLFGENGFDYYVEDGLVKKHKEENRYQYITKISTEDLKQLLYNEYKKGQRFPESYEEWSKKRTSPNELVEMANSSNLFENMDCKMSIASDGTIVVNATFDDISKLTDEEYEFLTNTDYSYNNYADYQRHINNEIEKKLNSVYGVSGINVDTEIIMAENGNMTKVYSSTYNDYTLAIPFLKGGNDFEGVSKTIETIINEDEQLDSTLGYTMSVRIDSTKYPQYEGYANFISDEDYHYVVLENGQRVKISKQNEYLVSDIENQVNASVQYNNYQVNNTLNNMDYYEKAIFDVKTYGENYHIYINGTEVIIPKSAGVFNEKGEIVNKQKFKSYCGKAGLSETEIQKGITLYNPNVAAELQYTCINFPDETFYKDLIEKLSNISLELDTPVSTLKSSIDNMESFATQRTKSLTLAMQKNIKSVQEEIPLLQERIEVSYKLLRATDDELKECLNVMINEIFELSYLDSSGKLGMNWYEYKKDANGNKIKNEEGNSIKIDKKMSLEEYFISKGEESIELAQRLKNSMEYGVIVSEEDIQKYGLQNDVIEQDGKKYIFIGTLNEKITKYCKDKEKITINDDYTIYQYLKETNQNLYHLIEESSLYISGDEALLATYTTIEKNEKFNKLSPYLNYTLSEEYDRILNEFRFNYDDALKKYSSTSGVNPYMSISEMTLLAASSECIINESIKNGKPYEDKVKKVSSDLNDVFIYNCKEREGQVMAIKMLNDTLDSKTWSWNINLMYYFEGLDYYPMNLYYLINPDGDDFATVQRNKYLMKYLKEGTTLNYSKKELEKMYKNGKITKAEKELYEKMSVHRDEIVEKYDSLCKTTQLSKGAGIMTFELVAKLLLKTTLKPSISSTYADGTIKSAQVLEKELAAANKLAKDRVSSIINMIKGGAAGGKVAHQLSTYGYDRKTACWVGVITAFGTYMLAQTVEKMTIGRNKDGKFSISKDNKTGLTLKGNEFKTKKYSDWIKKRDEELDEFFKNYNREILDTNAKISKVHKNFLTRSDDVLFALCGVTNIAKYVFNTGASMVMSKADTYLLNQLIEIGIEKYVPLSVYEELGLSQNYEYDLTKLLYPELNYDYAGRNITKFFFQFID